MVPSGYHEGMANGLHVDLSDPRVQQMLGTSGPLASGKREVVQLAGDAPPPQGLTNCAGGLDSTYQLTAGKQEVVVVFGDLLLTLDVYALPGEPMRVQIICPRCHKHSTIRGDQKKIEYEPKSMNPRRDRILWMARSTGLAPEQDLFSKERRELAEVVSIADFGRISIEPFECAWEIGDAKHVPGALHTGASLCRLRLVIEDNRAREA